MSENIDDVTLVIDAKIKAAAKLLEEANQISKEENFPIRGAYIFDKNLGYSRDLIDPILDQLSDAGWSTSSLSC